MSFEYIIIDKVQIHSIFPYITFLFSKTSTVRTITGTVPHSLIPPEHRDLFGAPVGPHSRITVLSRAPPLWGPHWPKTQVLRPRDWLFGTCSTHSCQVSLVDLLVGMEYIWAGTDRALRSFRIRLLKSEGVYGNYLFCANRLYFLLFCLCAVHLNKLVCHMC